MNLIEKVRNLPERKRKTILWCATAVIGSVMFFFWARYALGSLKSFDQQEFINGINLPFSGEENKNTE